ncbi:MAG: hypothetical protein M3169_05335 [Candidatus Eremiobacteraeota bacterium]|nr:hypothetical protein [Candidatus Eremiobacteraeota bacterium]
MPSKLADVVSALETLELPYVLYREESGSHRVLIEGSTKAAVLNAVAALGTEAVDVVEVVGAEDDDETVGAVGAGANGSHIVIEAQPGTGKSAASMLWWLALQEGSRAARSIAHADVKPPNVAVSGHPASNDDPE